MVLSSVLGLVSAKLTLYKYYIIGILIILILGYISYLNIRLYTKDIEIVKFGSKIERLETNLMNCSSNFDSCNRNIKAIQVANIRDNQINKKINEIKNSINDLNYKPVGNERVSSNESVKLFNDILNNFNK